VLAKLQGYAALGVESFILSGYPHTAEADMFARHVLPHIDHSPLLRRLSCSVVLVRGVGLSDLPAHDRKGQVRVAMVSDVTLG